MILRVSEEHMIAIDDGGEKVALFAGRALAIFAFSGCTSPEVASVEMSLCRA